MSKVLELFGQPTSSNDLDWRTIVKKQSCPYLGRTCIKIRKSQPEISIGTCSVLYGNPRRRIIICPHRLLENRQIFVDCLHLLCAHEPGNEIHIVPEVAIPGGNVDYFLVSVKNTKIKDFVGIELQTLDTTGTVWPARQRFLQHVGLQTEQTQSRAYGINWKMTAKTTLVQLHHKIQTFEAIHKYLVLVTQDHLLEYLYSNFKFDHVRNARRGDAMQFHAYDFQESSKSHSIALISRTSTDSEGLVKCLGLKAEPKVEFEEIIQQIERKMSKETLFKL